MLRSAWTRCLLLVCAVAAIVTIGQLSSADPPAGFKFSAVATADDLAGQIKFFQERIDESLDDPNTYTLARQIRVNRDAQTLGILALALAMHDADHPLKQSVAGVAAGTQQLAQGYENFASAKKASDEIQKSLAASAGSASELGWKDVATLPELMKQVPLVHNRLKRGLRTEDRMKQEAEEHTGYTATISAIALAARSMWEDSDPKYAAMWREYCDEMLISSGELNTAIRGGDFERATAAMTRLDAACNVCHAEFRD